MTGRHLLNVGLLAAGVFVMGAGQAFAVNAGDFNYSTTINGLTSLTITSGTNANSHVVLTTQPASANGSTDIVLFNIANTSTQNITPAPTLPDTSLNIAISIEDLQTGQTITKTFAADGGGSALFRGKTPGTHATAALKSGSSGMGNLPTVPLVYNYSNGDQFIIDAYTYTSYGTSTSQGGQVGSLAASVTFVGAAPEPGSLPLVATGLVSALGLFGLRRRRRAA